MKYVVMWAVIALLIVMTGYNTYVLQTQHQPVSVIQEARLESNTTPRTRTIPIVAVANDGGGVVEELEVKVTPGNNNVLISTNPFLEPGLQYSMNIAANVAKQVAGTGYEQDYVYTFRSSGAQLLGGESAGAAATVATVAALEGRQLNDGVAITGTVTPDGRIGRIGGVMEKAKAVADAGYDTFLVPEGQAQVVYYEREVSERPSGFGFTIRDYRVVPKRVDLAAMAQDQWDLEIVEVRTVDDALPYFINS